MEKIKKEEVLTSYNFARECDIVYSEAVTNKQFEVLGIKDVTIMSKSNKEKNHVAESALLYKKKFFNIQENDVIFSNLSLVPDLFRLLKEQNELKNIILVTSQTDIKVDKELFNLKPNCISKWYSINVDFEDENLIPIPLGLSNDYSPKNILSKDIKFFPIFKEYNYSPTLYLNFQVNTNKLERTGLYNAFNNLIWAEKDSPNLSLLNYQNKLSESKFVLCPIGNGLDTHRVWESLYLGSIPVIKKHLTYSTTSNLPVLITDDFTNINKETLTNFLEDMEDKEFESERLKVSYWMKIIRKNQSPTDGSRNVTIQESAVATFLSVFKFKLTNFIEKYTKKIYYYLKKAIEITSKIYRKN